MNKTPDHWNEEMNAVFARVYRHMEANQPLFSHVGADPVPAEHWQTTCWNAAWFAASCVGHDDTWVHIDENGNALGAEVTTAMMS